MYDGLAHRPGTGRRTLGVAIGVACAVLAGCGGDDPSGRGGPTTASTVPASPTGTPADGPSAVPFTSTPVEPPATSAEGWPPYASSVQPVTAARLGATWRSGCPVGPDDLRLVRVTYATADGATATGELVVAAAAADDFVEIFAELYAARFPITRMTTIDAYEGDDNASMAADNTSAFNCREVTGGTGWSRHSYGLAVDINPLLNPYVRDDLVLPPAGRAYLDRSDVRPGMIVSGDVVVEAFTSRGFEWGGDFETLKDYQHFAR